MEGDKDFEENKKVAKSKPFGGSYVEQLPHASGTQMLPPQGIHFKKATDESKDNHPQQQMIKHNPVEPDVNSNMACGMKSKDIEHLGIKSQKGSGEVRLSSGVHTSDRQFVSSLQSASASINSYGHSYSKRRICFRNGCNNMAVESPEWDKEYCSSECVVKHCNDAFKNWLAKNKQSNLSPS